MKRDYSIGFCADDSDLEELAIYCNDYLETIRELQVGVESLEKKALRELEETYLGAGHGSLSQYKKMFLYVALHIIARFERTHIVKIVCMSNGEWVLVCSCPYWENTVVRAGTCTRCCKDVQQ